VRYGSSRNKEATEIKIYQILFHNIEHAIPDKIVINGLSFLPRADLPKEAEQKIVRYVESKRVRKPTVESYGTTHSYAGTYRRRGREEIHKKNRCWSHQAKSPDPTRSSCTSSVLMDARSGIGSRRGWISAKSQRELAPLLLHIP